MPKAARPRRRRAALLIRRLRRAPVVCQPGDMDGQESHFLVRNLQRIFLFHKAADAQGAVKLLWILCAHDAEKKIVPAVVHPVFQHPLSEKRAYG